ncbi:hypothetical protein [Phocaeicola dorei]|uniref:hypothetical protein n=1 Tax=Phocaeicola dorei TaxID=357276 RepID=UPI0021661D39|nr:hypothetical protein [Phocaeicola dorei]MCS2239601.1 hypothetical protein [Phocaeicola dorei]
MVRETDKNGEGDRRDRVREDGGETGARQGNRRGGKENLYYAELGAGCFCPYFPAFLMGQAAGRKRDRR